MSRRRLRAVISTASPPGLHRAITALRAVEPVADELVAHLSPLGWEHVNLTGDYIWAEAYEVSENHDGYRPLRTAPDPDLLAA
ncbi:MAG: Tn3 family transposase [Alphaproteobacteria bacterium]|nr:Tn3 family transposase [Alphaproteobacteria bacterium]